MQRDLGRLTRLGPLVGLLLFGAACAERPPAAPGGEPAPSPPPTSTVDPWLSLGAPARISIPSIDLSAPLERLGLGEDQRIEVPQRWGNAGWYDAGFRPGEPGNALISGHYDDEDGQPAVFFRLGELSPGDSIIVDYPGGERYAFRVEDSRMVDADAVDQAAWDAIFGKAEVPRLSLVTCDGTWDAEAGTYDKRLILHARLDPEAQNPRPEGSEP